uniref:NADH dehydrogenase subunit 4L n=1 Tax=Septaria lineata TaxID=2945630 RepID=UPI002036DD20|nr:NADH dehydrogenase subunit 4L [Septaria lineata]URF21537.1 NADH dehydrogenase subunit 4L [Septaria lineata]USS60663.1 NADH dehydrogenase subunit 4L [Septaria lineata]
MMTNLTLCALLGVLMSILTVCFQYKHLLSLLLALEAITLSLFILLLAKLSVTSGEGYISLGLITLGACEASLSLAVLVSLIRTHGNDYVSSFNTYKC